MLFINESAGEVGTKGNVAKLLGDQLSQWKCRSIS